jgi:hypothetical protein
MRRTRSGCCVRAASGQAAAAPPMNVMNSRRLTYTPEAKGRASYREKLLHWKRPLNVRFGSKADMCSAITMSALAPKADIERGFENVR